MTAIAFLRTHVLSRSNGATAVGAVCYRHGLAGVSSFPGPDGAAQRFDYTNRAGVVAAGAALPEGASERWRDPLTWANEIEAVDKRKNSRQLRDDIVAIPVALVGPDVDLERVVAEYAQRLSAVRRTPVHFAIHEPPRHGSQNWHAHVAYGGRQLEGDRFSKKRDRAQDDPEMLEEHKVLWAEVCASWGLELDFTPPPPGIPTQEHLGPQRAAIEREHQTLRRAPRLAEDLERSTGWRPDPETAADVAELITDSESVSAFVKSGPLTNGARAKQHRHKRQPPRLRIPVPELVLPTPRSASEIRVPELNAPQRMPAPDIEAPRLAAPEPERGAGFETVRAQAKLEHLEAPVPTPAKAPAVGPPQYTREPSSAPTLHAPRTTGSAAWVAWCNEVELAQSHPPVRVSAPILALDAPQRSRQRASPSLARDAPSMYEAVGFGAGLPAWELEQVIAPDVAPAPESREPVPPTRTPPATTQPPGPESPHRLPRPPSPVCLPEAPIRAHEPAPWVPGFAVPLRTPTRAPVVVIEELPPPAVEPAQPPELHGPHFVPARGLRGWARSLWGAIAGKARDLAAPVLRRRFLRDRARRNDAITQVLAAWRPTRARERIDGDFMRRFLRDPETLERERARERERAEQQVRAAQQRQQEEAARVEQKRKQRFRPQSPRKRTDGGWSPWD